MIPEAVGVGSLRPTENTQLIENSHPLNSLFLLKWAK
jgi:hypothetical protein